MMPHDVTQADHKIAEQANLIWCNSIGGPDIPAIAASLARVAAIAEERERAKFDLATAYDSGHAAGIAREHARVVAFVREWNGKTADGNTFLIMEAIERGDHIHEK